MKFHFNANKYIYLFSALNGSFQGDIKENFSAIG